MLETDSYQRRRHVRESATYLAQAGDGEFAAYLVRLCELVDGRWSVFLMALPWDNREAENTFAAPQPACEAADALYAMGGDSGRWDIRRWVGGDPSRRKRNLLPLDWTGSPELWG